MKLMNCIWILLLLCCCGNNRNSCSSNGCGCEKCCRKHCDDCCEKESYSRVNACFEKERKYDGCDQECHTDFPGYGRKDRYDDYDRRDRNCETCGCEAE